MPARTVQDQERYGARRDGAADLDQVLVHSLDIRSWHDDRRADAALGAGRTKKIGRCEPMIPDRARAGAASGPYAGQRSLLADTGFILPPYFDRLAIDVLPKGCPR